MTMKGCLAISVYDKYDDLRNCIFSARHSNFSDIYVFATADANVTELKKICQSQNVDLTIVQSSQFHSTSSKAEFFRMITPRIWDLQRTAVLKLAESYDYIVHTHADGWILGKKFHEFIEERFLRRPSLQFLFRGLGSKYKNIVGSPLGSIDDHFYVINLRNLSNLSFFEKTYDSFGVDNINIHGILSLFAFVDCHRSRILHYDDTHLWVDWHGSKRDSRYGNPLRPFVLNHKLGLIHCHTDDFPELLGYKLQLNLWKNYGLPEEAFSNHERLNDVDVDKYKNEYFRMVSALKRVGVYQNRYGNYNKVRQDFVNLFLRPWTIPLAYFNLIRKLILRLLKMRVIKDERFE